MRDNGIPTGVWIGGSLAVALLGWALRRHAVARRTVRTAPLPPHLHAQVQASYPHLNAKQLADVERGLRQFFLASLMARGRFVAMPSKVVDAMWHAFILDTRAYESFCRRAFGRLLHHRPAEALAADPAHGDRTAAGLRRAWRWSCHDEGIDPKKPARLPMLFSLDAALAIPGGYHYVPDCRLLGTARAGTHCGAALGCGSSCGSDGGDGGGDGGGCGGE